MCAADGSSAMGQYREESASNHPSGGPGARAARALCTKFCHREIHRPKAAWDKASDHLSTAVETGVERQKTPAHAVLFCRQAACFQALSGLNGIAMIAASRSLAEGASTRRATPC